MTSIQPVENSSGGIQNMGPQAAKGTSPFLKQVGAFINGTVLGRFGAKAGHHSLLGHAFKIGMSIGRGILSIKKPVAADNAQPVHTHTFQKLSGEKAREMMPSVNAAKLANGAEVADRLKQAGNNVGESIAAAANRSVGENTLIKSITQDISLGPAEKKLLQSIKSICSERAYISPTGVIVDPNSGLRAAITRAQGEAYIVSFGATGATEETDEKGVSVRQGIANLDQYLGFEPGIYRQAKELTAAVAALCGKDKVSTAGHSLGGGLAQYAALHNGVKGRCFNGSPLGFGLQKMLGDKINTAANLIEHVSVRGDWLSYSGNTLPMLASKKELAQVPGQDTPFVTPHRGMSKLADLLGIRTRGNFGKKYYLNYDKDVKAPKYKKLMNQEFKKAHLEDLVKKGTVKDIKAEVENYNIDWEKEVPKKILESALEKNAKKVFPRHTDILDQMSSLAEA